MIIEKDSPSNIYNTIDEKLTLIINSLTITSDDPDLKQATENTREQLSKVQEKLKKQLNELKKNAEWNTFTMAFYGETGAGKSTLIETLRVLLNEPSKIKNQEKFRQHQRSHEQTKILLLQLKEQIQTVDLELQAFEQDLITITNEYEKKQNDFLLNIERTEAGFNFEHQKLSEKAEEQKKVNKKLLEDIHQLKTNIAVLKSNASLWQRLMNLFRRLPEEEKLSSALEQFTQLNCEIEIAEKLIESQKLETEKARQELNREWSEYDVKVNSSKLVLETQKKENESKKQKLLKDEQQHQIQLATDFSKLSDYADDLPISIIRKF